MAVRPKHFLVRRKYPWSCWHFDIRETSFGRVLLLKIEQPDDSFTLTLSKKASIAFKVEFFEH